MPRMRWALHVATAAAGLAAVVPALMFGRNTLRLAPLPAVDLGVTFSNLAATPAEIQTYALGTLSGVLRLLGVAAAIVCALALLTLAVSESDARRAELYVRRAVGASRRRLLRDGMRDGGAMALVAVALGIGVSLLVMRAALAGWPGTVGAPAIRVAVIAAVGAMMVLLLGATFPTFGASEMRTPAAPSAIPPGLTAAGLQLAIAFAVLLAATQIGGYARRLVGAGSAAARGNGQMLLLDISGTPAERARRLADLIRRSGFVDLTSFTSPGVLQGLGTVDVAITDCGRCTLGGIATPQRAVPVTFGVVSADTFRAMGVKVVAGRGITAADDWRAPRAVVVSRSLASAHFENGHAVGRRIQIGTGPGSWFRVVGVVEDTQPIALGAALQPPYAVYGSVLQLPPTTVEVLTRTGTALPGARHVMAEGQWRENAAAPLRWFANALWIGGALVLILAICGTGAATHLWVAALMPELAMRRAVGARRRDVLRHVLSRAVPVALGGVAFGLVLNDLTSGPLASFIPGVPAIEIAVTGRLALILLAAALAGALLPAWRASRAQPAALAALL